MLCWVADERPQETLEEMVRLEGLGSRTTSSEAPASLACKFCNDGLREMVPGEAVYRCDDCWGTFLECWSCIWRGHQRNPLHRIQVRRLIFFAFFSHFSSCSRNGMASRMNQSPSRSSGYASCLDTTT